MQSKLAAALSCCVFSSVWLTTATMAQTKVAPATIVPLTPQVCDLACQILKVPQKPGGGGGIINGITLDARVPGQDLGIVRPPSESLRLPDLIKNNLNINVQQQQQ